MHLHYRQVAFAGVATATLIAMMASAPVDADDVRPSILGATQTYVVGGEDSLLDIARRLDLGYVELVSANPGIDPWFPDPGTEITLPTAHILPDVPRRGIVINLPEMRLYFFRNAQSVITHAVGTGRSDWPTPTITTRVERKRIRPTWFPPASVRREQPDLPAAVPPGLDNPLGEYALDLADSDLVIHGTNKPYGVGRRISHGCLRLYPEAIRSLFPLVPVGTQVRIIDQPAKLAWIDDALYLEVHPNQAQADEIEGGLAITPAPVPELEYRVMKAVGAAADRIDWTQVQAAARERRGTPVRITR